jgi:hypothetical protein
MQLETMDFKPLCKLVIKLASFFLHGFDRLSILTLWQVTQPQINSTDITMLRHSATQRVNPMVLMAG